MAATFVHVEDPRRPSNEEGTLITFDVLEQKVWFWVIPFSNGRSSLGLVCPKEHLEVIQKENPAEPFRYIISQSDYYRQRFEGIRSDERRVGKEWGSTCRSRWSASH